MVDLRYNPQAKPSELTGGLYRAVAPIRQVYRPTEWNAYHVILRGSRVTVDLNKTRILDLDLSRQTDRVSRHDGSQAPALKDRPQGGHIGFQELSRGGDHVQIRNAQIRDWCAANDKILFDFGDIESWDPGGTYSPDISDDCAWCTDWCASHTCPECDACAHSHCFNCHLKGKAFWWMMARISGWEG